MRIKPSATLILTGIVVVLAGALVGVLLFLRNQVPPRRGIPPVTAIAEMEPDSARWEPNYPNQYATLRLTAANNARTTYGGAEPYSKLTADPRLVTLFAGYAFSKDYNEERGHLNSLIDLRASKRVNETTPGSCYSCKSSDTPQLWAQMGMAQFDKTPFSQLTPQLQNPIGCANCHEAESTRLIVTNPALDAALKAQGQDWRQFTRQEMRTVVCANCHVEYYFAGDGKLLTYPWAKGTRVENIAAYYDELSFSDWQHAGDGAPLVKIQHPEYELFTAASTHYAAGVSCADCHMPYTRDGAAKFSTHNVASPLLNAGVACGACHTDVSYVLGRVKEIQAQVRGTMDASEDALLAAVGEIGKAAAQPKTDAAKLAEARRLHREAQLRWDFVAAENSMGFHNPEEALRILAAATDLARQAQLKALEAAGAP